MHPIALALCSVVMAQEPATVVPDEPAPMLDEAREALLETETPEPEPEPEPDYPPAIDTPVIFPLDSVNLSASEAQAADEIFRQVYERVTIRPVYSADLTRSLVSVEASDEERLAACGRVDCSRWITVSLVRLDRQILVRATLRDRLGRVVHDFDTRADGLDDLFPVFDRLARSLAIGQPIDQTITRHNVTGLETQVENRAAVEVLAGFKVCGLRPTYSGSSSAVGAAFAMRLERDMTFMEVDAGAALPTNFDVNNPYGGLFADIGWGGMLVDGNTTPFLSAGLGPRLMSWGNSDPVGLGVYGSLGVIAGRVTSVRSYVQVRLNLEISSGGVWPVLGLEAGLGF
jgi:hypothetical protein